MRNDYIRIIAYSPPKGLAKRIAFISIIAQKVPVWLSSSRFIAVEQTWEVFDIKVIKNALLFKSLFL